MDVNLDFYVVFKGGSWCATERDNYAFWGKGSTIGEAIEDYCDQYLSEDELFDAEDNEEEQRTIK